MQQNHLSKLKDTIQGCIYPSFLSMVCYNRHVSSWTTLPFSEDLCEVAMVNKHKCITSLDVKHCGQNLITLNANINRYNLTYFQDFFFVVVVIFLPSF